jgi:hypothetical protein
MPNRLYINETEPNGKIHFSEQARRYGLDYNGASMTMAFADIDNDGKLDCYLATTALPPPPGTEFRVRFNGNKPVIPDELKEYWQLIYLPGDRAQRTEAGQRDHLYHNDGEKFTEITEKAGIDGAYFTLSATWWDYDNDGFPDLYVANDYFGPDQLYHNNRDGTFTDVAKDVLPHTPWFSMGTDQGDINNDGLIDFLATDMLARNHVRRQLMRGSFSRADWFLGNSRPPQYIRNALYLNSGMGRMLEAANLANVASTDWTWSPRLADFDNDGRIDLFIANGIARDLINVDLSDYADSHFHPNSTAWSRFWENQPMFKERNVALKNLGDLKFEDVSSAWGLDRLGVSFGCATADFNNDGNLDLVVVNADAPLSIYANRSSESHRIRIRLEGRDSNRFGIGAKIDLVAGGLRQARYLTLASGYLSSNEPIVTFGLGSATTIDELTINWPSGTQQKFTDLPADRFYTITEPSGRPVNKLRTKLATTVDQPTPVAPMFVPAKEFPKIEVSAARANDFTVQPLMPFKVSQLGSVMAWGDVDADGKPDCYVGGSGETPGRLFINKGNGTFSELPTPAFEDDRECDDASAVFFDADGDGALDLYVVSGGFQHEPGNAAYRDRLYLNDGHGHFRKAPTNALPDLRDCGSVVAACDFNHDGKIDLFVGSRCVPGEYPLPAENHLLVNVGGGRFEDQTPEAIKQAGMVTDAVWADVDGDGWADLVVTTDWGPVKVFANDRGKFIDKTADSGLAERLGLWRAIAAGDLNHDGLVDFVVTNFGLNTEYSASAQAPVALYYGDFDDMGKEKIVEAVYENQLLYPRRDLSVLRNAMPEMMAIYKTVQQFAQSTLAEVFTKEKVDSAKRYEVNTLESGVLINEGHFHFRFVPLPALAQIAPSCGIDIGDINGDGHLDLVMAQNFYGARPETGPMDGGLGLLLLGDGRGGFDPIWPNRSGIVVPGDSRKVRIVDLDGDGHLDLVFAVAGGEWRGFLNRTSTLGSSLRPSAVDNDATAANGKAIRATKEKVP